MGRARFRPRNYWLTGASAIALAMASAPAFAQDPAPIEPDSATDTTASVAEGETAGGDDIVVTGIRASLRASRDIKLNSQGVVDAITAEDIGKFPDTNLAE